MRDDSFKGIASLTTDSITQTLQRHTDTDTERDIDRDTDADTDTDTERRKDRETQRQRDAKPASLRDCARGLHTVHANLTTVHGVCTLRAVHANLTTVHGV